MKFECLMHHFNEESLADCFHELDRNKAVGVDQVSKDDYGKDLAANLRSLINRMKRMAYIPGPVKEVRVPKGDKPGAYRPIGISNLEDKIVQKQTAKILESIYEPLFLRCSYGFRPGRGCHDALKALRGYLFEYEVETIIDVDLENFFGTIDRSTLERFLRHKISDERFMRYIIRMLKSGVLSEGGLRFDSEGIAQGTCSSPILANIVAHHVIDQWFEITVKSNCRGQVALFRYADDMVICCRYESDAMRIKKALAGRLAKFALKLNESKTKMVSFSKRKYRAKEKQETFDFLGFTFYLSRSRRGGVVPKVKTSRRTLRSKLKKVRDWAKQVCRTRRLPEIWKHFCLKLRGHVNYFGVSFNVDGVRRFMHRATRILFKWLNRRSQRRSYDWRGFSQFMDANPLPTAKVVFRLY